ncbi:helix-turn-helix transcriptional regulator [Nocardia sp. NPDC057227]|uniref:helix-turn-helix transcriptional regulator n=1 Tax=Nocardia sp. NPDC057227 TaxID=3346056 RepID=UPI0036291031
MTTKHAGGAQSVLSADKPRPLATPTEIAEYLGTTVAALAQQRYRGEGAPYKLLGRRIRYDWAEVTAWVQANTVECA